MSIVASMTTPDGLVLFFDKFRTPDGRIPDVLQVQEEELQANGVNGRRYRTINSQYRQFIAQTIETAANYAQAITLARNYDRIKSQNVRLAITNMGGASLTYHRVHVAGLSAVPTPGSVAGSATPSHAAHVVCDWSMAVMEITDGANA